jgi:serine/threonine protein kinase
VATTQQPPNYNCLSNIVNPNINSSSASYFAQTTNYNGTQTTCNGTMGTPAKQMLGMPFTIPGRMTNNPMGSPALMQMNGLPHQPPQHHMPQTSQSQMSNTLQSILPTHSQLQSMQHQLQSQSHSPQVSHHSQHASPVLHPIYNNINNNNHNNKNHLASGLLCAQSPQHVNAVLPPNSTVYRSNYGPISQMYPTSEPSHLVGNGLPLQPKQLSHQNLPSSSVYSHHSLKVQPYPTQLPPHLQPSPHKQPYHVPTANNSHLSKNSMPNVMVSAGSTITVTSASPFNAPHLSQHAAQSNILNGLVCNPAALINGNVNASPLHSSPALHHLYHQHLNNQNNPNLLNRAAQGLPQHVSRNLMQALSMVDHSSSPQPPTSQPHAFDNTSALNKLNAHLSNLGADALLNSPQSHGLPINSMPNALSSVSQQVQPVAHTNLPSNLLPTGNTGNVPNPTSNTPTNVNRGSNAVNANPSSAPNTTTNGPERQSGSCSQQQQQQLTNQIHAIISSSINTSGIVGQLNLFQILKQIGSGQFSVVYRAVYLPTGQPVALKCIRIFELNDMKTRLDCINEISLLQRLNHTNIVRYHTSFLESNALYIVLELADCGDLAQLLKHFRKLQRTIPERTIWQYFRQIANGLLHMHENCILHRDIKPPNVFISQKGTIKLGDLGLSKYYGDKCIGHCCCADGRGSCASIRATGLRAITSPLKTANGIVSSYGASSADQITGHRQQHFRLHRQLMQDEANSLIGTPYYMAPERIQENYKYDSQSDIWSLGCILYEMAALQSPFFGEKLNLFSLCRKIVCCNYPPLPGNQYSIALRSLIASCLNADPRQRPSIELICDIAKFCSGNYSCIICTLCFTSTRLSFFAFTIN